MLHGFRRAGLQDLPAIQELAHRIWWNHYPDIISPGQITYMLEQRYSLAAMQAQLEKGMMFWLPLDGEGAPLGFAALEQQHVGTYFLDKFYLDNNQQGKGFGAEVLKQLLNEYPDLKEMRLQVNRKNFKSINFYFKCGFRIEAVLDVPIGNGFVMEDFLMVYHRKL